MRRMRMANQAAFEGHAVFRFFEERFEITGRSGYGARFDPPGH